MATEKPLLDVNQFSKSNFKFCIEIGSTHTTKLNIILLFFIVFKIHPPGCFDRMKKLSQNVFFMDLTVSEKSGR